MPVPRTSPPWEFLDEGGDNCLVIQGETQEVIGLFPKGDTELTRVKAITNCRLAAAVPDSK